MAPLALARVISVEAGATLLRAPAALEVQQRVAPDQEGARSDRVARLRGNSKRVRARARGLGLGLGAKA